MANVEIIKENGENVAFDSEKLAKSLLKSGATENVVQKIVVSTEKSLFNGISTKELYKNTFQQLKKYSRVSASKYSLKKGILEFGPSSFPFEIYGGELFKHLGYKVHVGVIIQENCVQHEVDVVAEKDAEHYMVECKFHNMFSTNCSVKLPLYIQSRFLDIKKQWIKKTRHQHKFHQGWLVNNTRFSSDAIQYGECVGLRLIGWDYPKNNSLRDIISNAGLYPITCLTTLKKTEKQTLLNDHIVLCKQLCENPMILIQMGIKKIRMNKIMSDAHNLCNKIL